MSKLDKNRKSAISRKLSDLLSGGIIEDVESGASISDIKKAARKELKSWKSKYKDSSKEIEKRLEDFTKRVRSGNATYQDRKREFNAVRKFNELFEEKIGIHPDKDTSKLIEKSAREYEDIIVSGERYWFLKDNLSPSGFVGRFAYDKDLPVRVSIMGSVYDFSGINEASMAYPIMKKEFRGLGSPEQLTVSIIYDENDNAEFMQFSIGE